MATDPNTAIEASEAAGNPLVHLLSRYGRPYWSYFIGGLLVQTLGQIPNRVPALVVGVTFDAVFFNTAAYRLPVVPEAWIPQGRMTQFWFSVAVIVGAYLGSALLGLLSSLTYQWFNLNLLHDIRVDTYRAMQRLSLGYFDDEQTGEVMSILNNDVENIQSFTSGTMSAIITMPLSVGIAFAFMAWLNWQLAVALLFIPILIPLVSYWHSNVIRPVHEEARARIGSLNSRFQNNISGIATIKANAAEEREVERVDEVARKRRDIHIEQARFGSVTRPVGVLIQNLGVITAIGLGGYLILGGLPSFFSSSFSAGAMVTFIAYTRSFFEPMRRLPNIVDNYENGRASANRITTLLADPAVIPEVKDAVELKALDGRVEYDEVTFGYEGAEKPTLCDISFEAGAGKTIGLVGPTGAGKSTITKLLFRFYDVDEGTVRIDGHDVRDVTLESLRAALGYVSQESFLFNGTVKENIAYSVPSATDEEIVDASRRAGAHEFVEDLSEGYQTPVGERGVKLSGGQRQRIAIARAILRDPAILILDEATSHVDNETEAVIHRNMGEIIEDRTTIAIAHRLSTVRDADRIFVLDDGEIVERGTHEELLDRGGTYADLWNVQVGETDAVSDAFLEPAAGDERGSDRRTDGGSRRA